MNPIPACWRWKEPNRGAIRAAGPDRDGQRPLMREWQDGRCAICGRRPERLVEDHDHVTAITRGFLCYRCNTLEGTTRGGVFAMYRECNPSVILGTNFRYVDPWGYEARPEPVLTPEEQERIDAYNLVLMDRIFTQHGFGGPAA